MKLGITSHLNRGLINAMVRIKEYLVFSSQSDGFQEHSMGGKQHLKYELEMCY